MRNVFPGNLSIACFVPMHNPLQLPYNNAFNQLCDVPFFHFLCFFDFFFPALDPKSDKDWQWSSREALVQLNMGF
jgi:hypothetical protein